MAIANEYQLSTAPGSTRMRFINHFSPGGPYAEDRRTTSAVTCRADPARPGNPASLAAFTVSGISSGPSSTALISAPRATTPPRAGTELNKIYLRKHIKTRRSRRPKRRGRLDMARSRTPPLSGPGSRSNTCAPSRTRIERKSMAGDNRPYKEMSASGRCRRPSTCVSAGRHIHGQSSGGRSSLLDPPRLGSSWAMIGDRSQAARTRRELHAIRARGDGRRHAHDLYRALEGGARLPRLFRRRSARRPRDPVPSRHLGRLARDVRWSLPALLDGVRRKPRTPAERSDRLAIYREHIRATLPPAGQGLGI